MRQNHEPRNPTVPIGHFIVLLIALASLSACQTLPGPAPVVLKQAEVATLAASQHPELFRSLSLHEPTIGSLIGGTPEGKAAVSAFGAAVAPKLVVLTNSNHDATVRNRAGFNLALIDFLAAH